LIFGPILPNFPQKEAFTMNWPQSIDAFAEYLQLERGLSAHTVEAYCRDAGQLRGYAEPQGLQPAQVAPEHLSAWVGLLYELGIAPATQARMLSGVKAFFRFLLLQRHIEQEPTERLEAPKLPRKLPEVLAVSEIDALVAAIDHSAPEGMRNRAMIEVLYSTGMRVSELVNLKMSQLHFDIGFVKVLGKGKKERFVPIGHTAMKQVNLYLDTIRKGQAAAAGHERFVFLNRRGRQLTRVMVFLVVKQLAEQAGLGKNVSPHTFRHSFATHLVEGGADLRAVQDMLGHESITTTEIYTHLQMGFLRQTLERFHPRGPQPPEA
jgi:integrase/recombinase XerD